MRSFRNQDILSSYYEFTYRQATTTTNSTRLLQNITTTSTAAAVVVTTDKMEEEGDPSSSSSSEEEEVANVYEVNQTQYEHKSSIIAKVSNNKKPYLIFHVGPPKTATSSLQMNLYKFRNTLNDDGYYCGGKFINPPSDMISPAVLYTTKHTKLYKLSRDMFKSSFCPHLNSSCLDSFKQELEHYRLAGKNVLLSEESYCGMWTNPKPFCILKEQLENDWELIIVAGYRHFYDWVLSSLFQSYRLDYSRQEFDRWPGSVGGKSMEHLTDLFQTNWMRWKSSRFFTSDIVKSSDNNIPVRIHDIQKNGVESITTNFFCNILPNATKTCKKSRDMDNQKQVVNLNSQETATPFFYDHITTKAAELGMINIKKYQRKVIRDKLFKYNEKILNRTRYDFDLVCPQVEDLNAFLEISIEKQREVFGSNFLPEMETEHREEFEKKGLNRRHFVG